MNERLDPLLWAAEFRAWDALSHYEFRRFATWVAAWEGINQQRRPPLDNPFAGLVMCARQVLEGQPAQRRTSHEKNYPRFPYTNDRRQNEL